MSAPTVPKATAKMALNPRNPNGPGGPRVLGNVLERLQAAEVDGGLGLLLVAADPVGVHADGQRGLAGLRLERRREPLISQERRVDAPREVPEVLERCLRFDLHL